MEHITSTYSTKMEAMQWLHNKLVLIPTRIKIRSCSSMTTLRSSRMDQTLRNSIMSLSLWNWSRVIWRSCLAPNHKSSFQKITLLPSFTTLSAPLISCTQLTSFTETSSPVISLSTRIVASKYVISVLLDRCQKKQIKKRNSVIIERNREKSLTKMPHQKSKKIRENTSRLKPQLILLLPSQKQRRRFVTYPTVLFQDGIELLKSSLLRKDMIKQSISGVWDASCLRWSIAQMSTKEAKSMNKTTDSFSQEHLASLLHHATRWTAKLPTRRRRIHHQLTLSPRTIKWSRS